MVFTIYQTKYIIISFTGKYDNAMTVKKSLHHATRHNKWNIEAWKILLHVWSPQDLQLQKSIENIEFGHVFIVLIDQDWEEQEQAKCNKEQKWRAYNSKVFH